MPISLPPEAALREFLGRTTHHTRRYEIYEADGSTRWRGDVQLEDNGKTKSRLKSGTITVDANRDERRSLELVLDNSDNGLINSPDKLWYDKIVKVFRGVRTYDNSTPRILLTTETSVSGDSERAAAMIRDSLIDFGFGDVRIKYDATTVFEMRGYDLIIALNNSRIAWSALSEMFLRGVPIISFGNWHISNASHAPWPSSATGTSSYLPGSEIVIEPRPSTHPVARGWSAFDYSFVKDYPGQDSLWVPSVAATNTWPAHTTIANNDSNTAVFIGAVDQNDTRWVMYHMNLLEGNAESEQFKMFLLSALHWVNKVQPLREWEVQIGEFMIDRISEPHFPREVHITGRDYAKKGMNSKFPHATQFNKGRKLEDIIADIAGTAGITKRTLPVTSVSIGRDFVFDRNVTRWDAMKELTTAYNYELFVDASGFLVMRSFRDPVDSTPVIMVHTGKTGQVATYQKSSSDTRIINSVLVVGESSDPDVPPKWAVAKNENPNSPTSILRIGERSTEFTSSLVETTAQAQELANSMLAVSALEEFELSFDSLMLPWLEVGDIMGWEDPSPTYTGPRSFLLSTLSLTLALGPMSAIGKRVMNVG